MLTEYGADLFEREYQFCYLAGIQFPPRMSSILACNFSCVSVQ